MESELITKEIVSSRGTSECSSVQMIADTGNGETELVIRYEVIERYPITDYKKVMKLYENLNRSGRKTPKLQYLQG